MGCDIHVMVEARKQPLGPDGWFNIDNWQHNPYFGDKGEPVMTIKPIYTQRNYELFAFLAGVRDYGGNPSFGFDRGFPEDACKHTAAEYTRWGEDAHTPGYATLAALKEKAGTVTKVNRRGYVKKEQIARFKETGETPTSWSQSVFGPGSENYEWMEWQDEAHCFDDLLDALEERKRDVFWIFNPEKDDGTNDTNIRIVFWFDN